MLLQILGQILNAPAWAVFLVVGLLVFAEDALFVGFVLPGETAAVLGGVAASRGHVDVFAMCPDRRGRRHRRRLGRLRGGPALWLTHPAGPPPTPPPAAARRCPSVPGQTRRIGRLPRPLRGVL